VKRQRPPGRLGEPARVLQLKPRLLMTYDDALEGVDLDEDSLVESILVDDAVLAHDCEGDPRFDDY
jgi:hypothetical protein